jgi:sulfur carrier protein ThiS
MPEVKLRIHTLLTEGESGGSAGFTVVSVSAYEGEGILELFRRLAQENRDLHKIVTYITGQDAHTPTVVLLNGRFLSPAEFSRMSVKEGDELTVLPLLDGG